MHEAHENDTYLAAADVPPLVPLGLYAVFSPHRPKECLRRLERTAYLVPDDGRYAPSPDARVAGKFRESEFVLNRLYRRRRAVTTMVTGAWEPAHRRGTVILLEFVGIRALTTLLALVLPVLLIVSVILLVLGIPVDFTWLPLAAIIGALIALLIIGRTVENRRISADIRWYHQFFVDTIDARPIRTVVSDDPTLLPERSERPERPPQPRRKKRGR